MIRAARVDVLPRRMMKDTRYVEAGFVLATDKNRRIL